MVGHFEGQMAQEQRHQIIKRIFFQKLEIIQAMTTLIDPGCSIWDEYGIQRSGRRFFTTRCTNMKIDKHVIELNCRWSTDRANGWS